MTLARKISHPQKPGRYPGLNLKWNYRTNDSTPRSLWALRETRPSEQGAADRNQPALTGLPVSIDERADQRAGRSMPGAQRIGSRILIATEIRTARFQAQVRFWFERDRVRIDQIGRAVKRRLQHLVRRSHPEAGMHLGAFSCPDWPLLLVFPALRTRCLCEFHRICPFT